MNPHHNSHKKNQYIDCVQGSLKVAQALTSSATLFGKNMVICHMLPVTFCDSEYTITHGIWEQRLGRRPDIRLGNENEARTCIPRFYPLADARAVTLSS